MYSQLSGTYEICMTTAKKEFRPLSGTTERPCIRVMELYGLTFGNAQSELNRNSGASSVRCFLEKEQQWRTDTKHFDL